MSVFNNVSGRKNNKPVNDAKNILLNHYTKYTDVIGNNSKTLYSIALYKTLVYGL